MNVTIDNSFEYSWELRAQPKPGAMPLASGHCTVDLSDLVDEAYTASVMADRIPLDLATLHATIRPVWEQEPVVRGVQIELHLSDPDTSHVVSFSSGPWVRTTHKRLLDLRSEGSVSEDGTVYRVLLAVPNGNAKVPDPLLQAPVIHDATLRDCGVRSVDSGPLDPDRPVFVNRRFAEEAVRLCEEADTTETGGAALGRLVRLPNPLTGTRTRIVSVLAAIVQDPRHLGTKTRFHYSPEALASAQNLCSVRGLGEEVFTVFHTHGFSKSCGNCNQNPNCPLSECNPSLHDYDQLLAQLFPSKSTLLPIAGRKLGAEERTPVLQVHAWSGGEMRPYGGQHTKTESFEHPFGKDVDMAPRTLSPLTVLSAAGLSRQQLAASPKLLALAERLLAQIDDGQVLIVEVLKARLDAESNKRNCAEATEAAQQLQQMLDEMLNAPALYYRIDSIRPSLGGPVAVCRAGGQIRELPVHPDVDIEQLKSLKPWEYVRVHENVIVGVWNDDPYLFQSAQGEVVTFRDHAQPDQYTVRVSHHESDERVVLLAGPLRQQELTPGTKLVLQRDQPHLAIAALPAQVGRNRFEFPIDQITTQLEDLAGFDWVAERLILDILKRIIYSEIQAEFDLDPLKGVLLTSRKPGMGKTSFLRAFAGFLSRIGQEHNFDLVVYHVKPNQTKSMWHGEDARIVREELFGVIRHRRDSPRKRVLLQLVIMDEIDSFGRRPGGSEITTSPAQADGIESLLVELDGFDQGASQHEYPAHLLVIGLSNRPDRIDDALKRPGRLGDLVLEVDALDQSSAEAICEIYVREPLIPWKLNGKIRTGAKIEDVHSNVIRPAMAAIFPLVVLRYYSDTQRQFDVTAGEILACAHYRDAMNKAKGRASDRKVLSTGHPAVTYDDVAESLLGAALGVAAQMAADPQMLRRQLDVKVPIARITPVPRDELAVHPYLRVPSSFD